MDHFKKLSSTEKISLCRSIGGEIASIINLEAFDYLDHPVLRIGGPFTPVPSCDNLEDLFCPGCGRDRENISIPFPVKGYFPIEAEIIPV